jgi:cobalt-zinc-cadmium efflux system outer membrane protein
MTLARKKMRIKKPMKTIKLLSVLMLMFNVAIPASAQEKKTLTLDTVINSAVQAFPTLMASNQRVAAAQGEYLSAEGAFDTTLKSQNRWSVAGLYENQNNDVSLEQPTALGGTTFFGGWRRGVGDYPVYDGKNLTAGDGEVRIGVNIPLWRNRDIDRRRASLKQADLGQTIARHDFDQMLLDVQRQAAYRYWDWILAGQRLKITEQLLTIAEQRDAAIRQRAAAGDIPKIEIVDNQRAIIERRERQVAAQRFLEQAAIQLSLYWRNARGEPQLPKKEQLPSSFPVSDAAKILPYIVALERAKQERPELKRLTLQIEQTKTELEFQNNQIAPSVDLSVSAAKDIGENTNKKDKPNRNELYVGLNIDIPLQRRVATGRVQVANANLQRLTWERTLIENRIEAEVKDVFSALSAIQKRLELSRQQQKAAQQLEEGERTRFELGDTTLLFVNLREIANGDAKLLVAEAMTTLFKVYADYQAALTLFPTQKPELNDKILE